MSHAFHNIIDWLIALLAVPDLLVTVLSLLYVVKLFRSNLKHYRHYKYVAIVDSRVLFKILFNYQTELYKYFLLGITLLFELSVEIFVALGFATSSFYFHHNTQLDKEINNSYFNCTKNLFNIERPVKLFLLNPWVIVLAIVFTLLFIILLQLFSFLCTYLKRRYNGYSLDNRVVSRYVAWWCIQAVLLFLCAIPYTQILLAVICPILLLINWIILVKESRRLSRAIRSVLYEILHFEYDDVRYRASYASYRTYRVFIFLQLSALLIVIVLITIFSFDCTIHYFILTNCRQDTFAYFHFDITIHGLKIASQISNFLTHYFAYLSILFYELVSIAPMVLLVFIYLSRYFTKKIKLLMFDRHLAHSLL